MSDTASVDIEELEKLAKAATPGPWEWENPETDNPRAEGEWNSALRTVEEFPSHYGPLSKGILHAELDSNDNMDADAAFIAAANPQAILALISEKRALERDLTEAREDAKNWRKHQAAEFQIVLGDQSKGVTVIPVTVPRVVPDKHSTPEQS